MQQILNTLYIMTQGAYLHLDHETLKVKVEGETGLQIPIHHLGAIVCFGNILVSPFVMHRCAEDNRSLVWMGKNGRFKARLTGPTSGNILLRQEQYRAIESEERTLSIARNMVAGKIQNVRHVVLRVSREAKLTEDKRVFRGVADKFTGLLIDLASSKSIGTTRGIEGKAAAIYFSVFGRMISQDRVTFHFNGRNRRPPRDPVNALLSFLYALLLNDCVAGAEGVGLDSQAGYLHAIRPGRPSLGLDLMEELRPVLGDRLALTLINRRQINKDDFILRSGGAILLNEPGRKKVVTAYQKRKTDQVLHPVVDRKISLGLVSHLQARMLARHLRGDMEHYIPFIYK
ncbi:MAG: type I-C CRISPR-associated endonuclease Cas1 [Dehalococcoidia bacterium]|nr:type I-C CRISPR-associated endonuclease Cas1 [Dehalococcoidia bacterium]